MSFMSSRQSCLQRPENLLANVGDVACAGGMHAFAISQPGATRAARTDDACVVAQRLFYPGNIENVGNRTNRFDFRATNFRASPAAPALVGNILHDLGGVHAIRFERRRQIDSDRKHMGIAMSRARTEWQQYSSQRSPSRSTEI